MTDSIDIPPDAKYPKLIALIHYLIENSPDDQVGFRHLLNMLYMCDWKSVLVDQRSLTDVPWLRGRYGPSFTAFFKHIPDNEGVLKIGGFLDGFGKDCVSIIVAQPNTIHRYTLTDAEKDIAAFVLKSEKQKTFIEFDNLTHSTYPMLFSSNGDRLHLASMAEQYKSEFGTGPHQEITGDHKELEKNEYDAFF